MLDFLYASLKYGLRSHDECHFEDERQGAYRMYEKCRRIVR